MTDEILDDATELYLVGDIENLTLELAERLQTILRLRRRLAEADRQVREKDARLREIEDRLAELIERNDKRVPR